MSNNLNVQVVYLDELQLLSMVSTLDQWTKPILVLASMPSLIMPTVNQFSSLVINTTFQDGWDIYEEKPLFKYLMYSQFNPKYELEILKTMNINNTQADYLINEMLKYNETELSDRYDKVACDNFHKFIPPSIAAAKMSVTIGAILPDENLAEFHGLFQGLSNVITISMYSVIWFTFPCRSTKSS